MQTKTALTGKPIYRMSSFAPTRGPVNPQGYLQRELRKQGLQGNDGQSDRRSGLASNMLRNRGIVAGEPGHGKPGTPRPNYPGGGNNGGRTGSGPMHPAEGTPTPGGPYGGINPDGSAAHTPTTPGYVSINADGTLELPFDFQTSSAALQLTQDLNAQLLELMQNQQGADLQYEQDMRSASQGYTDTKRNTLNSASASGNAFGSAYGYAVGRDSNAFQNLTGNLTAAHGLGQANTVAQQKAIERDFNQQLAQLALEQALAAAENAGTLGYGHGGKGPKGSGGKGGTKGGGSGTKGGKKHPIKMTGVKVPPPKNGNRGHGEKPTPGPR